MIMKDVVISITGVQQGHNGPNAIELVTQGRYGVERDKICLSYQETELTGMDGTETTFTVHPKRVELERKGGVNAQMVFQEGQKHFFLYETPFGAATMGINTNRVQCALGEHGGYMQIDYTIDMENSVVGRNRFHIFVKETEKSHIGDVRWPI